MLLRGTVTDNQDPMQRGRCRVFIWGMHKDHDPNLPWAEVIGTTHNGLHQGVGAASVLQVGTTVWVMFEQSEIQCPVIVGTFVGHTGNEMMEIKPETSDFPTHAKGDKYGKVTTETTPCGHNFTMDCTNGSINLTTPNGFGIKASDKDKEMTLSSPCGLEIKMDCNTGKIFIKGDIVTDGHITANAVFAPNLCTCGTPGPNSPVTSGVQGGNGGDAGSAEGKKKAYEKQCNPQISEDGRTTCNTDFEPDSDTSKLKDKMKQLLEKAQEVYKAKHGQNFNVCEANMSVERFECLRKSGLNYPEQLMCGLAVYAIPHNEECSVATAGAGRSEAVPTSSSEPEAACGALPKNSYVRRKMQEAEKNASRWKGWDQGALPGLSEAETKALMRMISYTETAHTHASINQKNKKYFGEWQVGAAALWTTGYISGISAKAAEAATVDVLKGNIWSNKNGVTSFEKLLNDRNLQQVVHKEVLTKNLEIVKANSKDNPTIGTQFTQWWNKATARERMGFYYASQFGQGNARQYVLNGKYFQDGNKTAISDYFDAGVAAYDRWVCGK